MKVDRYVLVSNFGQGAYLEEDIMFDAPLERLDALELINHFNRQASLQASRSGRPLYTYYLSNRDKMAKSDFLDKESKEVWEELLKGGGVDEIYEIVSLDQVNIFLSDGGAVCLKKDGTWSGDIAPFSD